MKKEEIDELMRKVEVLKDALGNSAGYAKPVWRGLMLIGISVFVAYLLEQITVWTNKFSLDPFLWIGFTVAVIGIILSIYQSFTKNSNKDGTKKAQCFSL